MANEQTFAISYLDHDGDELLPRGHLMSAQDVEIFVLLAHGLDVGSYLDPADDEDGDDD
jgi:hypothetical protein